MMQIMIMCTACVRAEIFTAMSPNNHVSAMFCTPAQDDDDDDDGDDDDA